MNILDNAQEASDLDAFFEILAGDTQSRLELLTEAQKWGLAPAKPDQEWVAPTGDPMPPPPASKGVGVEIQQMDEEKTAAKKRKAVEQSPGKGSEVQHFEAEQVAKVHKSTQKARQAKRRKTGEAKGEVMVASVKEVHRELKSKSEDVEMKSADEEERTVVQPKRTSRRPRKSVVSPAEVTSDLEEKPVGSVIHVRRASQTWPEWHGLGGDDSEAVSARTGAVAEEHEGEGEAEGDDGNESGSSFNPDPQEEDSELEGDNDVENEDDSEMDRPSAAKKPTKPVKAKSAKRSNERPKKIAIQSGILTRPTAAKGHRSTNQAPNEQISEEKELLLKSVGRAAEYAERYPDKVRLLGGDERCANCRSKGLSCWIPTEGRRKTCNICYYSHKGCLRKVTGLAEVRRDSELVRRDSELSDVVNRPALDTDLGRAELLGLETIMSAAFGLQDMDVDEQTLMVTVGQGDEEEGLSSFDT